MRLCHTLTLRSRLLLTLPQAGPCPDPSLPTQRRTRRSAPALQLDAHHSAKRADSAQAFGKPSAGPETPLSETSQHHRMVGAGGARCGSPAPPARRSRVTQSRRHRTSLLLAKLSPERPPPPLQTHRRRLQQEQQA